VRSQGDLKKIKNFVQNLFALVFYWRLWFRRFRGRGPLSTHRDRFYFVFINV